MSASKSSDENTPESLIMEQNKKNVGLVVEFFHNVFEQRNIEEFPTFISPELKVHKNHDVWDYQQSLAHSKALLDDYPRIEILPFDIILPCGDFVTVEFTQRQYSADDTLAADKFIAVVEIKADKICAIRELTIPAKEE